MRIGRENTFLRMLRNYFLLVQSMTSNQKINFLKKFVATDANECWPWLGCIHYGYGKLGQSGTTRLAHRVMWEHVCGVIPKYLDVLHHCDNKRCVNPAHLYLGDDHDNARDRAIRNLTHRGEEHWSNKLSEENVIAIRASKESYPDLAKQYHVSVTCIQDIKAGRKWKHIKSALQFTKRAFTHRYNLLLKGI